MHDLTSSISLRSAFHKYFEGSTKLQHLPPSASRAAGCNGKEAQQSLVTKRRYLFDLSLSPCHLRPPSPPLASSAPVCRPTVPLPSRPSALSVLPFRMSHLAWYQAHADGEEKRQGREEEEHQQRFQQSHHRVHSSPPHPLFAASGSAAADAASLSSAAFLHDRYHVKSAASAARQAQTAALSHSYREVSVRKPTAFTLAVDLPVSTEGRTVQQRPNSEAAGAAAARRRAQQERLAAEFSAINGPEYLRYSDTPSLPAVGHARSYSSVSSPPSAARPGSASQSPFLSQLYSPPSRPATARVASPSPPPRGGYPAQARQLAAVHARVDSGLGSTLPPPSFDQRQAWNVHVDESQSARLPRPSGASPYGARSAAGYADEDQPSGVGGGGQLYMIRTPSAPAAAPSTPSSARNKASKQRMLSPSPPATAPPASSMPLTPTRTPQLMMSSLGGIAADGSVVPMRATFVASHTPRSGDELRVDTPISPPHRDLMAQPLSPSPPSQLQSSPSQPEYNSDLMVHRADLTDPFVNLAHAVCCSLLRPEHVPSHLPYVAHLPIEHVLAEVPAEGTAQQRSALRKQAGPPPSRLIDLHLDVATIQSIASRFAGLPCLVLGRQMERRALCGVLIESIQADSSSGSSTVTAAKVRLLDFLVSITSLRRQELWSVINGALPALTLWYVHFDTAAEVVARCAEQGVKARVVHMKKTRVAASAPEEEHSDDELDDAAAKFMVPPPIPFVFYSMHLSALTAYSPKLVWTLASLWREKAQRTHLPNFMFRPTPAEMAEKERIREWKATQSRVAIENGGTNAVSHARSHSAQLHAAGWTKPGEFRSPTAAAAAASPSPSKQPLHTPPRSAHAALVPYSPPAAIVPAASEVPFGSTSLTPSQLNSLPPRAQKRALRKEILLLLNQKHFMSLKKEELVATKVQLDVAAEEMEKEIAAMDASNEATQKRLAAERQALDRRVSQAAEQKVADESSLATARATLAARENSNSIRESSLEAQQKDLSASLEALEAEKKAVLLELERNEQEISRIATEKQKLAEGELRLENEKKTTQAERESLAAEAAQVREEELRAQAEKTRLSELDRSLQNSLLSLQEQQGMVAIDREVIEKENAAIEAAKQQLAEEKAAMDAAQAANLRAIESERDAMVAREESIKAAVVAEREGVEAALRELREGADKIHLAKNLEEEEAKIQRLKDEVEAERQALRAEHEANLASLAKDKANLEATRLQLIRDAETKMQAWEQQKAEEIAQREHEEKERQAALVAERLEKYKMKRMQIGTDAATLAGPSPASKLSAQLAASSAASATSPEPFTPAEPVTPLQHKQAAAAAAFEAAAAPKKLILNSDDIASLTPAQKKEFTKSQQRHAEMDEMYRVFLGVSFKALRKSGPPAIYLLLQITLDKIDKFAVLLGSQPILELHTIRAKTSSVVEESEVGKGESHAFNPMIIDLQRLCALQLERTVLLKVTNASRSEEDPRGYIAETRLNLVEMQSHSVVPLVHMDKAKRDVTGKKLLGDFGRILIKRSQLMVDSTHGITHFSSPNTRDPSNPIFEKLTSCLLRMEARATDLTTAGGLFGPSKDVAPVLEFVRKDAVSGTFDLKSSPAAYRTEVAIGSNVTFLPVRVGLFELCYHDINRPILCRVLHEGMGKMELISEFEFTVATVLAGAESDFAAGPADKKTGARSGKITFHSGRVFSALTDLARLCDAAGLVPSAVVKSKDNADCPPLGLDAVLVENAAAVKRAQAAQTPVAFNNGIGEAPVPLVAGAATAASRSSVGSGHARRPSSGLLGTDSIKSPSSHRKNPSSAGGDKMAGLASKKKKKTGDKEPATPI